MKSPASNGVAFRVAAVAATTIVLIALMVTPSAASGTAPLKDGNTFTVNTQPSQSQQVPCSVKRPDGKYVVVWQGYNQGLDPGDGVFMQILNADGSKNGPEVNVPTGVWYNQRAPRVAVAADNSFVVVWHSTSEVPDDSHIYSQRFDSNGAKIGSEFRVNYFYQRRKEYQYPDVAFLTNGDVVYAWRDDNTGNGRFRVATRRFNSNFQNMGIERFIHDSANDQMQLPPRIAPLVGGGFVVVFQALTGGYDGMDAMAQVFDAASDKIGLPFAMHTVTLNSQEKPDVAALPNGGFVAVWSHWKGSNNHDIQVQRFSDTGVKVGSLIKANTQTGPLTEPSIAGFSDNSFIVAWWSSGIIGLQYVGADGNKVGSEIQLSGSREPTLASNFIDGNFGAFWTGPGITGQLFLPSVPGQTLCTSACLRGGMCYDGEVLSVKVTGVTSNDVWGVDPFTDDSNLAAAAVFAGLVADGETSTIIVKCSGPQTSFASGSANGVTTQAYLNSWPSSFTFDLGGATPPPPPPAPPRCWNEPCASGKCKVQGTFFDVIVTGSTTGNVWGTAKFTDDSSVSAAAVHQGILAPGVTGTVSVACSGFQDEYLGSESNGVTSNSYGPWQFSYVLSSGPTAPPVPTSDVCVGGCLAGKCAETTEMYLRVAGQSYGYVWGSGPFTEDSTVSTAAIHAGLVTHGVVAVIKVTCTGANGAYTGSIQNGITAQAFGPYPASFELAANDDNMPTVSCTPADQCLYHQWCEVPGRVIKLSVTGSKLSGTRIWGTGLYSDDSPVSHAAVHAGLVQDGQTKILYATCEGPKSSFTASTANGITSESWTSYWPGSFTLATTL